MTVPLPARLSDELPITKPVLPLGSVASKSTGSKVAGSPAIVAAITYEPGGSVVNGMSTQRKPPCSQAPLPAGTLALASRVWLPASNRPIACVAKRPSSSASRKPRALI